MACIRTFEGGRQLRLEQRSAGKDLGVIKMRSGGSRLQQDDGQEAR